jgi:hypothetical protein
MRQCQRAGSRTVSAHFGGFVQGFRESEDILRARGPMDEIKVNIILDAVANDQIDRLREILRNPTLDATEVN